MCTFKNLEENWKTWKNSEKTSGNPEAYFLKWFTNCIVVFYTFSFDVCLVNTCK